MTLRMPVVAPLAVEALDDDQIAARLGGVRQQVNQICRTMGLRGLLTRRHDQAARSSTG